MKFKERFYLQLFIWINVIVTYKGVKGNYYNTILTNSNIENCSTIWSILCFFQLGMIGIILVALIALLFEGLEQLINRFNNWLDKQ